MEKPYIIDAEGLDDEWEETGQYDRGPTAKPVQPPAKTDKYALHMLKQAAIIRANKEAAPFLAQGNGLLTLEPTLHYNHYDGTYLTLRVGYGKLYIIKDLWEFITALSSGAQLSFGKDTLIIPHRSAFEDSSIPLLDFAVRHFMPVDYGSEMWKRRIKFTSAVLDEFLELMEDGAKLKVECDAYGKIKSGVYRIRREDVPVKFRLSVAPGGARLVAEDKYLYIGGLEYIHLVIGNDIYLVSQEYNEQCKDFLEDMTGMQDGAFFAAEDIPTLFTSVIEATSSHLRFDIDESLLAMRPEPLLTKIFFDLAGRNVTARVEFHYGGESHYAFDKKYVSESHDLAGEARVERMVSKYMGYALSSPGTLFIRDEDALFMLIDEGVDELSEIAEIYASEDFDGIKKRSKPVVAVGVRVEGNLLEIDIDPGMIDFSEISEALRLYRAGKKYKRMTDGSFLAFSGSAIEDMAEIADGLGLSDDELVSGKVSLPLNNIPFVDGLMKDRASVRFDRDEAFRRVVRDIHDVADADYAVPEALTGVLRNYQASGYRWLRTVDALGFGGILADDMGLGKTLQALALLENARLEEEASVSIVVCPASVVLNWAAEAEKFAPGLRVAALIGGKEERERVAVDASDFDLIVTSYSQIVRDIDLYKEVDFRYIMLDEAQFIKNHRTKSARSVKLLRGRARYALTGTPVENNLAELWSIFDFIMPGYLYAYSRFRSKFEIPISKDGNGAAIRRLQAMARPFMLRRLKTDVLKELPEKTETILSSPMAEEQRKLYLATLVSAREELRDKLDGIPESQGKIEILAALTRLRQVCCDPALVFPDYKERSAKLDACLELIISCLESGHRMLIFSQFTSMLAILRRELERIGINYSYLDGSTPKQERHALMGDFNAGSVPVFLISLKAGGVGLNLTGADIVIHYDPWWNVSAENQATDRAHRIGQKRNVQVFKLIAQGSIEEKILKIQEKKKALAESVIKAGEGMLETMTRDELMSLFSE